MHLIHKLRRSISHRPRHLFDLPDEILCQILEYCCQDLDFLLWSCPLVTLDNQFCHDCFHCTLCHGPAPRVSSFKHRHLSTTVAFAGTSKEIHGRRTESASESGIRAQGNNATTAASDRAQHRKRRKRTLDTLILSSNHSRQLGNTRSYYAGSSPSPSQQGAKPCPWNGYRPWCLHLQCQQQDRISVLWRLVPPQLRPAGCDFSSLLPARFSSSHPHSHLAALSTSLAFMQLPAKVAFNTLLQRIEAYFSWDRSQLNESRRIQGDESIRTGSAISTPSTPPSTLHHANPVISLPSAPRHAVTPMALASGFRLDQDASLYRRKTTSMSTRSGQSATPSASMNRSLSTTRTINTPNVWRRGAWIDPADDMDESETTENGQHRDDFDSSIHLSSPFQLLLVSRRFADAAVHSLHRNLVFHGHDPYQVECVLSTLLKDNVQLDQDQDQDRSTSLRSLKEVNEEQLVEEAKEEEVDQIDNDMDQMPKAQGTSRSRGVDDKNGTAGHVCTSKDASSTDDGLWPMGEGQGASVSWIESLNHSLRRFSRFQGGVSGVDDASSAEIEPSKVSFLSGNTRFAGEGDDEGGGKRCYTTTSGQNKRAGEKNQDDTFKMNSNEPKWTYRRYARRVVLNFAHPQASPQLLVQALECIGSRCHGQIQALDLHANEKMQDSGLETSEELTRLFGSGFTKLRYLRLQGGFVDNQLLYALLNNFASPTLTPPPDSAHVSYADGWRSVTESRIRSPPPALIPSPCCLSQVFLGPGSVTDSGVERLIDVAGKTLEVFTVTSCVDVGGGALASLLTKCPKLRVLAVHRSLARDRELLEGLGIPLESAVPGPQQHQQAHPLHLFQSQQQEEATNSNDGHDARPQVIKKAIVAPLERLELGTVKLTNIGITEILKATSKTLRFLVLETQHFKDGFLRNVVSPLCTGLEGLHFDDPEQVQRLQQQMQGLGFSAGRRGPHLPRNQVVFGRLGRSFYSDPRLYYRSQPPSHHNYSTCFRSQHHNGQEGAFGSTTTNWQGGGRDDRSTKVSAWLGETTTDEWVTFGDCALWSGAASPAVSYDNGGTGGPPGGRFPHQHRQHGQPLHQMYHKPALAMGSDFIHGSNHHHRHQAASNWFLGDSDELLDRHRVARVTVDEVQEALSKLETFTVMDLDFVLERKGLYESQSLMRQDDIWVQSAGFRALQMFYLCLFLSTIYFSVFR